MRCVHVQEWWLVKQNDMFMRRYWIRHRFKIIECIFLRVVLCETHSNRYALTTIYSSLKTVVVCAERTEQKNCVDGMDLCFLSYCFCISFNQVWIFLFMLLVCSGYRILNTGLNCRALVKHSGQIPVPIVFWDWAIIIITGSIASVTNL